MSEPLTVHERAELAYAVEVAARDLGRTVSFYQYANARGEAENLAARADELRSRGAELVAALGRMIQRGALPGDPLDDESARYVEAFNSYYANDEMELDEPAAATPWDAVVSVGDDGGWVRCWQFIERPEGEEEEEED